MIVASLRRRTCVSGVSVFTLAAVMLFPHPACTRLDRTAAAGAEAILGMSAATTDTAAVLDAAAAHYKSATRVSRNITIRGDTSWATVYHGEITFLIARLERRGAQWQFVREEAHGVH